MKVRDIKIITYVGLVLACLLITYYLIRESILEIKDNQKDLQEKELTLEKKEDYLQNFEEASREYKKNKDNINKVSKLLLSKVDLPLILIQLEALATDNKVEIESIYFSPLEMSDKEIGVIPVSIHTKSEYVPLKKFLNAIAKNLNIIEVENMTLETEETILKTKEKRYLYLGYLELNIYTNVSPEIEPAKEGGPQPVPTGEETSP